MNPKYDIITFGSTTQDVFLKSKNFKIKEEKKVFAGKGICISLGSKIMVEDIEFLSGGGGTNTAFTFKNQGFKVAYCGVVGEDFSGRAIKKELKNKGISTEFLYFTNKKHTNYSVILATDKERTILVYRGASDELKEKDILWQKLKAKWFYLAPFSQKLIILFEKILKFAKRNKIKIAINPGNTQLQIEKRKLKKLLNLADVLILNQEEASLATNLPYDREKEIFKKLDKWIKGICIMTKGPLGGIVSDGKYLYYYGILKTKKEIDHTGLGDAFGSGFITGLIKTNSIEYAIQLASANATSCLLKLGAKKGLLKKNDSIWQFGKVPLKKIKIKE